MNLTPAMINARIAKGDFRPHTALTNMAMAYYQKADDYFAKAIFPTCPVKQSADSYYIFNKEDLLRDSWQRKPEYGQVMPAVVSEHTETYNCEVYQMIMGISQIRQTDLERRQAPATADPRVQRTKTIAEQANIHQDKAFASKFFKPGIWTNEWTGVDGTTPSDKQFIKFSSDNSDPVKFIADRRKDMRSQTGRTPNRLALGANVFNALCNHAGILERVKYSGSTANPATITANVLAQLFGVEKLVVMESIMNSAKLGADAQMGFIGDPDAMLLAYATNTPSIDEPSAGYIFTWDMLGDGKTMPIMHRVKNDATHAEEVEGLMAYDMRKTADDLGMFFKEVV